MWPSHPELVSLADCVSSETQFTRPKAPPLLRAIAVWGPGLLVMLADTDAGNVVTAAQAGVQWRYRLLPLY